MRRQLPSTPIRFRPDEPWVLPQNAADVWFTTSDGVRLHGWFLTSNKRSPVATVIYFHGNAGNLSHVAWVGRNLASAGFDVLLFDYRGYGRSAGETDGETGLNKDGDAAYEYVVDRRGVRPERLVLYGQSLGTTVAADVASRRACGALILESGLSSAASMAAVVLPWLPRKAYVV
ncbi:MAG: alpha/beta fold hydrolase, partial [Pyrinomonadaceae bacterium]|nr:alpha/beta fold hydrolase [Pyrinomonadaceae bacterium]